MTEQEFANAYESIRTRFNTLSDGSDLKAQINAFIVAKIENERFNHFPHAGHLVVNGLEQVGGPYAILFSGTIEAAHTGIDWAAEFYSHTENTQIEMRRRQVSAEIINVIRLLGEPENYVASLAHQKLLATLNFHFLDDSHYEEFKQIQNKVDNHVARYAHAQDTSAFAHIIKQNTLHAQQQSQTWRGITEIKTITTQTNDNIAALTSTVATKEQIQTIMTRLSQQGIDITDGFLTVITQNEMALQQLETVLLYLETEQIEKIRQQQLHYQAAQYQGLRDACQFTQALAAFTDSQPIQLAANAALQSVNIMQSVQGILQGGFSGFALLSPYSAIGMAILNLCGLFRSSHGNDVSLLILKQLNKISYQLNDLKTELSKTKNELFFRMDFYFTALIKTINHLQYTLTLPTMRKLSEISTDLQTLFRLTQAGFDELLLKDLKQHVTYVSDLERGISQIHTVSAKEFEDYLRNMRDFALQNARSDYFTGLTYAHLLSNNADNRVSLNKLLSVAANDVNQLQSLLGLLFLHAKNTLKIPTLRTFDINTTVHPEIWFTAIITYLKLQKQFSAIYSYDPKGFNIADFTAQAEKMLSIIKSVQTEDSIYTTLLMKMLENYSNLQIKIQAILQHHTNEKCVVTENLATRLKGIKHKTPTKPIYSPYVVPNHLTHKSGDKNFFKLEQLHELFVRLGLQFPPITLLIEQYNMGHFEYRFHAPEQLDKKHNKSSKHGGKYKLGSCVAGFEINFYYQGRCIPLYRPNQIARKQKFGYLSHCYSHIIQQGTVGCYNPQIIADIEKSFMAELLSARKTMAHEIYTSVYEQYHEFVTNVHWLQCYLHVGGFSEATKTVVASWIVQVTRLEEFNHFAKTAKEDTPFPTVAMMDLSEFNAAQIAIATEIKQFVADSNLQLTSSPLARYFIAAQQAIYENEVFFGTKEVAAANTNNSAASSRFFSAPAKAVSSTSQKALTFTPG